MESEKVAVARRNDLQWGVNGRGEIEIGLFGVRNTPDRPNFFLKPINVENIKQPVFPFGCSSFQQVYVNRLAIRLSGRSLEPNPARRVAVEVSFIPRKFGVPAHLGPTQVSFQIRMSHDSSP